jgi:hypothetical protein
MIVVGEASPSQNRFCEMGNPLQVKSIAHEKPRIQQLLDRGS